MKKTFTFVSVLLFFIMGADSSFAGDQTCYTAAKAFARAKFILDFKRHDLIKSAKSRWDLSESETAIQTYTIDVVSKSTSEWYAGYVVEVDGSKNCSLQSISRYKSDGH